MKMDYQFLIGRDFSVGNDVYTVRDVEWIEDQALVQAAAKTEAPQARSNLSFPLNQVLQWLLVEEEIVLFNPSFLGAAGSYSP